ncbi:MAG TPA: hypothetical protein VK188_02875, partial [Holophaga sp.]|nr:hypothetical protein [Holophaga sp.]
GHRWADLACLFAQSYLNENWSKVQANARMLLAEVLEGDALAAAIGDLEAFGGFVPQASSRLRGAIATQLIEKGSYPIVQY